MTKCDNTKPHDAHVIGVESMLVRNDGMDWCEGVVPDSFKKLMTGPPAMPVTQAEANEMRNRFMEKHPGIMFATGESASANVEIQMDALTDMMMRQLQLQIKLNPGFERMTNNELMEFIRTTIISLLSELNEMLGETNWKPWAAVEPGINNKERYLKEIIDAQHFLFNLALVAGVKPHEYYLAYIAKNEINIERQDNDYEGNNPRCEHCGDEIETYKTGGLVKREEIHKPSQWWCSDECYHAQIAAQEAAHHNQGSI